MTFNREFRMLTQAMIVTDVISCNIPSHLDRMFLEMQVCEHCSAQGGWGRKDKGSKQPRDQRKKVLDSLFLFSFPHACTPARTRTRLSPRLTILQLEKKCHTAGSV